MMGISLFILFFSFELQYFMMKYVYPYKKEMSGKSYFEVEDVYVTARAIDTENYLKIQKLKFI